MAALAGCGDDVDSPAARPSPVESSFTPLVDGEAEIVIKTYVDLASTVDRGRVLDGSSLGDAPFCPQGTTSGGHGNTDNGWLDKTFECPDGTLTLAFDPRDMKKQSASGPWEVLSGTGAYEGMEGSGRMEIEFAADPQVPEGHESFTGTVSQ
ncbi:MAG TPA: hypothetical protein VEU29_08275 [Actinomycetota bacterium]|nr:hypothetical protein [Actinomycetota bacterium]